LCVGGQYQAMFCRGADSIRNRSFLGADSIRNTANKMFNRNNNERSSGENSNSLPDRFLLENSRAIRPSIDNMLVGASSLRVILLL
jgi:hypothetical protein